VTWEPEAPTKKGLPWFVTRKGGQVFDSNVRSGALIFPSTAAETINNISVYLKNVVGSATYQLQAFLATDLHDTSTSTAIFQPNEDAAVSGAPVGHPTNTAGSLYTNIDEVTSYPSFININYSDYLQFPLQSANGYFRFRANAAGGLGAGNQNVSNVRFTVWAKIPNSQYGEMVLRYSDGTNVASKYFDTGYGWTVGQWQEHYWDMAVNPITNVAWTEADIQNFDASPYYFEIFWYGTSSIPGTTTELDVAAAAIVVTYSQDPNLFTPVQATASADGWLTFALAANWSKPNATNIALLLRRVAGTGSATWASLDSGATMPKGDVGYRPTLDSSGSLIDDIGAARTEDYAYVLQTTAPAASVDSQPYVDLIRTPVDVGHTVQMQFTETATSTRQYVSLVAGSSRHQAPAADLTVKIKRQSDNVQMGGTGTIQVADIDDAFYPLQVVECILATGAALTNGTQYYVELTCTAVAGQGWDVSLLDTKAPPVSADLVGYGGTTDRATIGGTGNNDYDVPSIVAQTTTAPTTPTAVGA
jgi:hypothetical protein